MIWFHLYIITAEKCGQTTIIDGKLRFQIQVFSTDRSDVMKKHKNSKSLLIEGNRQTHCRIASVLTHMQ